jgi:hypothetical protein
VVFEKPIRGIEPAHLPNLGQFESVQPAWRAGYRPPQHARVRCLDVRRARSRLPAPLAEPGHRGRWELLRRLRWPQLPGCGV